MMTELDDTEPAPSLVTSSSRGGVLPAARESWASLVRQSPLGLLVLAALLAILGAGLLVSGIYLSFGRAGTGWLPIGVGLAGGPLAIYVARNLLRRRHWAWLVILLLLVLLVGSSVWRLAITPPFAISPIVELLVEGALIVYLTRPALRAQLRAG